MVSNVKQHAETFCAPAEYNRYACAKIEGSISERAWGAYRRIACEMQKRFQRMPDSLRIRVERRVSFADMDFDFLREVAVFEGEEDRERNGCNETHQRLDAVGVLVII